MAKGRREHAFVPQPIHLAIDSLQASPPRRCPALCPAVNVAQHSYFNLAGHDAGSVLDHVVRLNADHYTPVRDDSIPTGAIAPVAGTPFDFTTPHAIGERIAAVPGPAPGGYDHNYVLFGMGPQAKYICKNGMASDK